MRIAYQTPSQLSLSQCIQTTKHTRKSQSNPYEVSLSHLREPCPSHAVYQTHPISKANILARVGRLLRAPSTAAVRSSHQTISALRSLLPREIKASAPAVEALDELLPLARGAPSPLRSSFIRAAATIIPHCPLPIAHAFRCSCRCSAPAISPLSSALDKRSTITVKLHQRTIPRPSTQRRMMASIQGEPNPSPSVFFSLYRRAHTPAMFCSASLSSYALNGRSAGGRGSQARMDISSSSIDRKSTRLNSSHSGESRMPSSA